jgi:hypothetical protein
MPVDKNALTKVAKKITNKQHIRPVYKQADDLNKKHPVRWHQYMSQTWDVDCGLREHHLMTSRKPAVGGDVKMQVIKVGKVRDVAI